MEGLKKKEKKRRPKGIVLKGKMDKRNILDF